MSNISFSQSLDGLNNIDADNISTSTINVNTATITTLNNSNLVNCTSSTPSIPQSIVNKNYVDTNFMFKTGNVAESINGAKTFNSIITCAVAPVNLSDLCNRQYVDGMPVHGILDSNNIWSGTNQFNQGIIAYDNSISTSSTIKQTANNLLVNNLVNSGKMIVNFKSSGGTARDILTVDFTNMILNSIPLTIQWTTNQYSNIDQTGNAFTIYNRSTSGTIRFWSRDASAVDTQLMLLSPTAITLGTSASTLTIPSNTTINTQLICNNHYTRNLFASLDTTTNSIYNNLLAGGAIVMGSSVGINTIRGNTTFSETATFNVIPLCSVSASSNFHLCNKIFNDTTYLSITNAASTYLTQTNAASTYLTQTNAASTYLTQTNAASTYLTQTNAASTYQTITGMSSYLTTATAASTYLTQTNAASTYQTITGMSSYLTTATAASTYLTQTNAASTYLTQTNASSTYQTITGMSSYLTTATAASTYLTQTNAASTYLTQTNASSTYQTITGMSSYLTTATAASTYLTQTNAASTYLTQTNASSTYQPISSMSSYALLSGSNTFTGLNTFSSLLTTANQVLTGTSPSIDVTGSASVISLFNTITNGTISFATNLASNSVVNFFTAASTINLNLNCLTKFRQSKWYNQVKNVNAAITLSFPLEEYIMINSVSSFTITLPTINSSNHLGLSFSFVKITSSTNIITLSCQGTNKIIRAGSVSGSASDATILNSGFTHVKLCCMEQTAGNYVWTELNDTPRTILNDKASLTSSNAFTGNTNTFNSYLPTSTLLAVNSNDFTTKSYVDTAVSGLAVGSIIMMSVSGVVPTGYYLCDGSSYSIGGQSQRLFNVIGYTYGGAPPSTFKVPDFRGYFLRGLGGTAPNQSSSIGMPQSDGIKSHTHDIKFGHNQAYQGTGGAYNAYSSTAPNYNNPGGTTGNLGAGRATGITETNTLNEVETRPVSYPIVYLIKN